MELSITYVAAVIATAVIEMKMYGTTFKGIYRLFLDIIRIFIKILTFSSNFISLKIYKLVFFAKVKSFKRLKNLYSLNVH